VSEINVLGSERGSVGAYVFSTYQGQSTTGHKSIRYREFMGLLFLLVWR